MEQAAVGARVNVEGQPICRSPSQRSRPEAETRGLGPRIADGTGPIRPPAPPNSARPVARGNRSGASSTVEVSRIGCLSQVLHLPRSATIRRRRHGEWYVDAVHERRLVHCLASERESADFHAAESATGSARRPDGTESKGSTTGRRCSRWLSDELRWARRHQSAPCTTHRRGVRELPVRANEGGAT